MVNGTIVNKQHHHISAAKLANMPALKMGTFTDLHVAIEERYAAHLGSDLFGFVTRENKLEVKYGENYTYKPEHDNLIADMSVKAKDYMEAASLVRYLKTGKAKLLTDYGLPIVTIYTGNDWLGFILYKNKLLYHAFIFNEVEFYTEPLETTWINEKELKGFPPNAIVAGSKRNPTILINSDSDMIFSDLLADRAMDFGIEFSFSCLVRLLDLDEIDTREDDLCHIANTDPTALEKTLRHITDKRNTFTVYDQTTPEDINKGVDLGKLKKKYADVHEKARKEFGYDKSNVDQEFNKRYAPIPGASFVLGKWHISPAVLLSYDNVHSKTFYLLGMDEDQYFGVELPGKATNLKDAYTMLVPKEIRDKKYTRQGEWFIVNVPEPDLKHTEMLANINGSDFSIHLPVDDEDSNHHWIEPCYEMSRVIIDLNYNFYSYNCQLTHEEHATFRCDHSTWYKYVINTAVKSVSVDGVD